MELDLQVLRRSMNGLLKRFDYRTRELPIKELKEIKTLVRRDDALIAPFVDDLFKFLKRDNADLRLAILLLTNHFFQRSHRFRVEIVENLQDFMLLTLEIDPLRCPLPPPAAAAKELKREALHIVRAWIEKFGAGYSTLANAERYLSVSKQFDFENSIADSVAERRREEKERLAMEARAKCLVDRVADEFEEQRSEIERALTECCSAIEIAYPKFVDLADRREGAAAAATSTEEELNRLHGYAPDSASMRISIPLFSSDNALVKWSDDNRDLLTSLQDSKALLSRYAQKVGNWLKRLSPAGECGATLTRQLIVVREKIAVEWKRCELLNVEGEWWKVSSGADLDSSDDGEDEDEHWIEVPALEIEDEPGTSQSTVNTKHSEAQAPTSRDSPKKPGIPTLPYGLDLKYWGEEKLDHPQRVTHQLDSHPFWRPPDDDYANGGGGGAASSSHSVQAYTTRVITFAGTGPSERRECRARLRKAAGKDGRPVLCNRRDFYRCPIHGLIVERDEKGVALNKEDRAVEEEREKANDEREKLMLRQDIEATLGCDLGSGARRTAAAKRTKREKPESKKRRERLKAKLLGGRTMRRVGDAIESGNEARARERFQHQFNYT